MHLGLKIFVSDLKEGQSVDSLFSVKYKRAVLQYQNGWRFSFGASDKTGEIEVGFWGSFDEAAVRRVCDSFGEGDVVRVQGLVGLWKERKKIDVNEGKGLVQKAEKYDLADFLPSSGKDLEQMRAELLQIIGSVGHEGLRKLLNAFFEEGDFLEKFVKAPGAMYLHHAWVGGLLEHSLSVCRIATAAAKEYAEIDLDLVAAGALLHDVGKVRELEVTTNIKVGEEGMLRGHVVIGEEMVRKKALETGLDAQSLLKISHMMLSHHGNQEYGAPKPPMFAEALVVYYADELDSKASQFVRIKRETASEDFRVYDKHLGEIYLK